MTKKKKKKPHKQRAELNIVKYLKFKLKKKNPDN